MSSREALRRKSVLPVTVVRGRGAEKQVAHTLDVTGNSARLAGLTSPLTPGETIEIQRGALRGEFQVVWMGEQRSALDGHAGVRSLNPDKSIWSGLPDEEPDQEIDISAARKPKPPVRTSRRRVGDKREHMRYACTGKVAIKIAKAAPAIFAGVRDISSDGAYILMRSPLPVNTGFLISFDIEGICFEATATVRTSHPSTGMGIRFKSLIEDSRSKLFELLKKLDGAAESGTQLAREPGTTLELRAHELAEACHALAAHFEEWLARASSSEIEDLSEAVRRLHEKLSRQTPSKQPSTSDFFYR